MWFNLNFEGESREELDFLQNKAEQWEALKDYSDLIIGEYSKLDKAKDDMEVIQTQKWWDKVRYLNFGTQLAKKLNADKNLMKALRAKFSEQNDRLSYFDLFQFIEHQLGIKLKNFEEDALEGRLDRLSMAFIEFNEFNEYSMEYGIDWGEDLLETDMEDILDQKLNLSYKDYQLTKDDYFQGCKTMLTTEKAALARCRQIWYKLHTKDEKKYTDKDFGPKDSKDDPGNSFSLYKTGKIPQKGYIEPEKVDWISQEELCEKGQKP